MRKPNGNTENWIKYQSSKGFKYSSRSVLSRLVNFIHAHDVEFTLGVYFVLVLVVTLEVL